MAVLCAAKFVYLLYLWSVLINVCASYQEYSMRNKTICHPLRTKKTIKLSEYGDTAVFLKSHLKFDGWHVTGDSLCKFVMKTKKGDGLFAVIQNISFRRNGTGCIDYVEFKRKDGQSTKKFCGQMNSKELMDNSVNDLDESSEDVSSYESTKIYAEDDPKGEIETNIFVSKESLHSGEILDISIIYTPYKECDRVDSEKYVRSSGNVCIWKGYSCDGNRNCPFASCPDETVGCEIHSNGTGTKVTVGAVTTIFLCFLLFVICLWTCRRHKKLCWSSDCAGPSVAEPSPESIEREIADATGRSTVPTAPMLDEVIPSPLQDKDLPPSYDSLFPGQSNPTTT